MGKSCMECGAALQAQGAGQERKFCSDACRKRFNNRRATRGAELYDYYLSARFQRSTHASMITVMAQMANFWREDDKRNREGRQSWVTPERDADPHAFSLMK